MTTTAKKQRVPVPERVASLIAKECRSEKDFDAAFEAFVSSIKPACRKIHTKLWFKDNLLLPLSSSIKEADSLKASQAMVNSIVTNDHAVDILVALHNQFKEVQQQQALREAALQQQREASIPEVVEDFSPAVEPAAPAAAQVQQPADEQ
jgi:hypothetical protein